MGCIKSDQDIIEQILTGRQDLYAILVNKYKQQIYGLLSGMGASHEDAQDTAQDAFIKAYRKLADHDRSRSFVAWLYTIAIRTYQDRFKRKQMTFVEWDQETLLDEAMPETLYLRSNRSSKCSTSFTNCRQPSEGSYCFRYTNECTYEEICEITELSMHQVKNALYRAKHALKKCM
ncbi:sigma-70 family RNA polymerase sigma factor [Paenibacillus melissococcoides]|uniref:Sigma-70 family RNA polymerase sigma factor n=1 Tax=Paenibacillus melissococcoides TaxID=2912268 RepID=A0ABN8UA44_9BACL|nr:MULTISPECIES: sigma-70 family RNA polymerase sigma factor [Paenibacillus]MEB9895632.1 sigma-70 family RNA polymerase sigma factor [Bacillus cereus]CAH8246386.1 sigma-70 family RNA polymerase sigma factor [Paenibacillus melissococcoides]CAH8714589.1 sigma-70 family RNA polymerase sigma factor [Paenibacillus melissococcoides]CAH8715545.1 sigma-70 family RNA polymerase sigma factor [Paenibacillus melissococcoides]GIO78163.1 RNA polymerase sigma-H factor [Paenibacillus dendritiformis]